MPCNTLSIPTIPFFKFDFSLSTLVSILKKLIFRVFRHNLLFNFLHLMLLIFFCFILVRSPRYNFCVEFFRQSFDTFHQKLWATLKNLSFFTLLGYFYLDRCFVFVFYGLLRFKIRNHIPLVHQFQTLSSQLYCRRAMLPLSTVPVVTWETWIRGIRRAKWQ